MAARLLAVDDSRVNVRILEALLVPRGYRVVTATSGVEALTLAAEAPPDLVLLDIHMPGMDGHEVCHRLRAQPATRFVPVVMLTASEDEDERLRSIEAGADDFIVKPFKQSELCARVRSLLRVKEYHDTVEAQAAELAGWNRNLAERVRAQIDEIERLGRLRRFLSPQLAELVVARGEKELLESHRREIAVMFCDLRAFTPFVDAAAPETVMAFLRQYHQRIGDLVFRHEGTLEHFEGDGVMVFFNDPVPCPDPTARAVRLAAELHREVGELVAEWRERGHELGFGVGIALGEATLGMIGFEGRRDYAAVGTVVNLAARLCGQAPNGHTLLDEHAHAAVQSTVAAREVTGLTLKGFSRPIRVFELGGAIG